MIFINQITSNYNYKYIILLYQNHTGITRRFNKKVFSVQIVLLLALHIKLI